MSSSRARGRPCGSGPENTLTSPANPWIRDGFAPGRGLPGPLERPRSAPTGLQKSPRWSETAQERSKTAKTGRLRNDSR